MSTVDKYELYTGNHLDILPRFDDCTFDLTITSPPYDKQRKYKGFDFQFEPLAKELYRVTKNGGVVVWIVNDSTNKGCESLTSFKQAIFFVEQCGFNLHDTMIYAKNNYVPLTHNRYEQQFEYMFVLSKGKPKTFNPIMIPTIDPNHLHSAKYIKRRKHATINELRSAMRSGNRRKENESFRTKTKKIKGNIWFYSIGKGKNHSTADEIAFQHPAIIPEPLVYDHVISWSNPGDLILDPMVGSGTVGKMCGLTDRRFIGIDISEYYIEELAKPRIEKAYKKPKQLKLEGFL